MSLIFDSYLHLISHTINSPQKQQSNTVFSCSALYNFHSLDHFRDLLQVFSEELSSTFKLTELVS